MSAYTIWRPWSRGISSLVLAFMLLALHDTVIAAVECEHLQCMHGSSCQVVESSGSLVAKCLCPLGWVGQRCQATFQVTLTSHSMTTVTLSTSSKEEHTDDPQKQTRMTQRLVRFGPTDVYKTDNSKTQAVQNVDRIDLFSEHVQYPEYSVQYWSLNQSNMCNILPRTTDSVTTVSGLRGGTDYIFCAKTNQINQCNLDLVTRHSNMSFCVKVRTKSVDSVPVRTVPKIYIVILVTAAAVSVTVLCIIIIFAINRKYICNKHRHNINRGRTKQTYISHNDGTVESLLSTSPPIHNHPRINIHAPSSPGKPEHHLVQKRMRGYAAFAARNEQTIALSTVIEYDLPEDEMEKRQNTTINQEEISPYMFGRDSEHCEFQTFKSAD